MSEKISFSVPSSDGIHNLAGIVYMPSGEVKGFFQVVHGMTEYIARYDRFLCDMADEGWISFGYDHLGHGSGTSFPSGNTSGRIRDHRPTGG